jgi:hypothetical protein
VTECPFPRITLELQTTLSKVEDQYGELLAPVHRWMVGDTASAFAAGAADLSDVLADGPGKGGLALDLGAGFGMHAIPLASAGYELIAIDSSELLLEELCQLAAGLPVRTITVDLMGSSGHMLGGLGLGSVRQERRGLLAPALCFGRRHFAGHTSRD